MLFPADLWNDPADREIVGRTVDLFESTPLLLTDRLTNSVFFNDPAEALYGEAAEAIVNRAAWSLLGFDFSSAAPTALEAALLGSGDPWKGIVRLPDGAPRFCEASAVVRDGRLVCGMIRFAAPESD